MRLYKNLDGINGNDIVVSDGFNQFFALLQNPFAGTFAAPVAYQSDSGAGALAVGDTNQDGTLDVVTANQFTSDFTVLRGSKTAGFPDGGFWADTNYGLAGGSKPDAVITGDLNGDGRPT